MIRPVSATRVMGLFAVLLAGFLQPHFAQAQVEADKSGFGAHFHAEDRTFFAIEDPLPHLKAFLTSAAMRRLVSEGPLGDLLKEGDQPLDLLHTWDWVTSNRQWIPMQAAIGISDAGWGDLDHLFRALALLELIQADHTAEANANEKVLAELKTLRAGMLTELKELRLPRLRIYARFDTPQDAAAVLDKLKFAINDVDPKDLPPGLKFDPQDKTVTAHFTLSDFITTDEEMLTLLTELHVTDPNDDALNLKLAAAARQFKAEASLRVDGAALLLTLGPADAGGPAGLPPELLTLPGAVGRVDAGTLVWGHWNILRLKESARQWAAFHEQWVKSTAYANVPLVRGSDSMLDTIGLLAVGCRNLPEAGSGRLWFDTDQRSVHVAALTEKQPVAAELSKSPIARFIPADAEAYSADMSRGLGEAISDGLATAETVGKSGPRALMAENRAGGGDSIWTSAEYYAHFGSVHDLLHKAGRDRFEPGYAVILASRGIIGRIETSFEVEGRPITFSGRGLPSVEAALIGRPRAPADEEAVKKYAESVYSALATGVQSFARNAQEVDKPIPPIEVSAVDIDLGLGVPTWGFSASSLPHATGEAKIRLAVDGDLRLHFFVVDGCVIFSTSPRLSKALLAARSGNPPALGVAAERDGIVISNGKISGDAMVRLTANAGNWYGSVMDNIDRVSGGAIDKDERAEVDQMFAAAGQTMRLVGSVEWKTMQAPDKPTRTTRGAIHFK